MKGVDILKKVFEYGMSLGIAIAIFFVINVFVVNAKVQGQSMDPTYKQNDYLIVNKTAFWHENPKHGDTIVFSVDRRKEKLIKRIIGVPGDTIKIKDGKVYINDSLLVESYINSELTNGDIEVTVPNDSFFVMGDNRQNSLDSRSSEIGMVRKDKIVGKVSVRVFPEPEVY